MTAFRSSCAFFGSIVAFVLVAINLWKGVTVLKHFILLQRFDNLDHRDVPVAANNSTAPIQSSTTLRSDETSNLTYTHASNQSKWKRIKKRIHLKTLNPRKHRRRKRKQGTVYRCGLETQTGRLPQFLFDDYFDDSLLHPSQDMVLPLFKWRIKYSPADILVLSAGNCSGLRQFYYVKYHWLRDQFPGKVLYLNAESTGDRTGNQSYMISSQASHERNVQVTFAAMTFIGMVPQHLWPILTWKDHPRPRNTGEHFVIYLTSNCVNYRQKVALALSQVGVVHHGHCVPTVDNNNDNNGNTNSNFTRIPSDFVGGLEWTRNVDLFRKYRFCLVLENTVQPRYITEKLLMAFLAGCAPIWYGTKDVWDMFHKDSFLFVEAKRDYTIQQLVRKVRYLEENATAYQAIFDHPILANGNATLETYFSLHDSVGRGRLKHEIRVMMGLEDDTYQQSD
jgi:hypothetical protein